MSDLSGSPSEMVFDVPGEVIEAAEKVRVWMESRGHKFWQLNGICDRRFAIKSDEEKNGIWWCFTHYREATHVEKDGRHRCDPKLAGIMMPCDVGLAVELKSWNP